MLTYSLDFNLLDLEQICLKYTTFEHKLKVLEKTDGNNYKIISSIFLPALVMVSVSFSRLKFKQPAITYILTLSWGISPQLSRGYPMETFEF